MKYLIGAIALTACVSVSAFAMPVGTAMSSLAAPVVQARVVIPPGRNANVVWVAGHGATSDSHVVPPHAVPLSPSILTTPSATSRSSGSSASTAAPQSHVVPPGALKLAPLQQ